MRRQLFWGVLGLSALGLCVAIWLAGPKGALFPGLLALFAFTTAWTTADFQLWTRRNVVTRENADIQVYGGDKLGFAGADNNQGAAYVVAELLLANPGTLFMSVGKANWTPRGLDAQVRSVEGTCLHPRLSYAMPEQHQPKLSFPVPVFPGGLTKLRIEYSVSLEGLREVPDNQEIVLEYAAGGYPPKQVRIPTKLVLP